MKTKMTHKWLLPLFFLAWVGLTACEDNTDKELATLNLKVDLRYESSPFLLVSQVYQNEWQQDFSVEAFRFYLSNFKFKNLDGNWINLPDSYILVTASRNEAIFNAILGQIPADSYTEVAFQIGVDEARNKSTARIGDLDPNNIMAWNWEDGYIFLRLDGTYFRKNAQDQTESRGLVLHIGREENLKTFRHSFSKPLVVTEKGNATLALEADIAEIFKNPENIDFETQNEIMGGSQARLIAANYEDFLKVKEN
ncbi:MbnP family protein [Hugenholtzia roseola]|uniref:MbnP family protein n=1 Tax=Hugenholtzia roseola TaxID=1002 RepID=UPI00041D3F67|nr:MbnP family protein [Hugenholtzia roseola]